MPYVNKVARGILPVLNVFGNDYDTPDGTGVRDYIHVMDLAEGHIAALNFLEQENGWHVVNLGTGRGFTVLELITMYQKVTGQNIPYNITERRSGDIASCYAKSEKALKLLNWQANSDIGRYVRK